MQVTPLIDIEFGMTQLSGNRKVLVELLEEFSGRYASADQQLSSLVGEESMEPARSYVHTIKGVTANLGLKKLNQACQDLEQAIKQNSALVENLAAFNSALAETVKSIKDLATQSDIQSPLPTENSPLTTLRQKLKNNEFIDKEPLDTLLDGIALNDQQRTKLSRAIDDLEYPTALALLATLTE